MTIWNKVTSGFKTLIGLENKEIEGLKWTAEIISIAIQSMSYLFAFWTLKNSQSFFDVDGDH